MLFWEKAVNLKRIWRGIPRGLIHFFSYIVNLAIYERRNRKIRYENINRILVIEIANIGDVIMAMPVISALRAALPHAKISMVTQPGVKDILKGIVDEIFGYTSALNEIYNVVKSNSIKNQIKTFLKLRKRRFDLIVDLRSDLMTILLAAFGNAKYRVDVSSKRVKPALKKAWCELTKKPYREEIPKHEIDVKCEILKKLGIIVRDTQPKIYLYERDRLEALRLLEQHKVNSNVPKVIIHPGTLWVYKQWGIQNYAMLAQRILDKFGGYVIILTGSKSEKKLTKEIISIVGNPRIIDLAGETSLRQLAALMQASHLVICNDSMAAHLAGAVGTPVIALFGPQDFRIFGPRGENVQVVKKEVECSPCRQDICLKPENSCMSLITLEEVFSLASSFLENNTVSKVN